jgi:hypothetical protein
MLLLWLMEAMFNRILFCCNGLQGTVLRFVEIVTKPPRVQCRKTIRGGSLSFLVGTISNVLVMEIGWTDVGSGGYILVSCAHSYTDVIIMYFLIKSYIDSIKGITVTSLH